MAFSGGKEHNNDYLKETTIILQSRVQFTKAAVIEKLT